MIIEANNIEIIRGPGQPTLFTCSNGKEFNTAKDKANVLNNLSSHQKSNLILLCQIMILLL